MLSAREMACMQATAQMILDKAGTITRPGTGTDAWCSPGSGTPQTIASNVACALNKTSPQMLTQYAEKLIGRVAYTALFALGTDIKAGDTLTVGGKALKVEAVPDLESYAVLLSVLVVEVS
jgi:hypothetical protein